MYAYEIFEYLYLAVFLLVSGGSRLYNSLSLLADLRNGGWLFLSQIKVVFFLIVKSKQTIKDTPELRRSLILATTTSFKARALSKYTLMSIFNQRFT